jgi:hypothetical protein
MRGCGNENAEKVDIRPAPKITAIERQGLLIRMSDRCAVITTLNGEIVEWKVFDSAQQAMDQYNAGVGKLQEMLQHTEGDNAWEVMLCDVRQYALSKPQGERESLDRGKSIDWYSRYLTIMAGQAKKLQSVRSKYSLHLWRRLRGGIGTVFNEDDEPTVGGL